MLSSTRSAIVSLRNFVFRLYNAFLEWMQIAVVQQTETQATGMSEKDRFITKCGHIHDAVADQLLTERPMHWLPAEFESWDALLLAAAQKSEELLMRSDELDKATWGQRNQAKIRHPLSAAASQLSAFLDMPELPPAR